MPDDVETREPAEDAGSVTYRKYRVQAIMALPYLVGIVTGEVTKLVMEHIEDFVVIRTSGHIGMHQVKTRDDGNPWTFNQLLASASHGKPLDRMFGKYRVLSDLGCDHHLHLQGGLAPDARALQEALQAGRYEDCADMICVKWDAVNRNEVLEFCAHLAIATDVPAADLIDDAMKSRVIYPSTAQRLSAKESHELYIALVDMIGHAMEAELESEPGQWLEALLRDGVATSLVDKKTINLEDLANYKDYLGGRVLTRLDTAIPDQEKTSTLVDKLKRGAADEALIEHVQMLRANAYARQIELLTAGAEAEKAVDDVRARMNTRILSVLGGIEERPAGAGKFFNRLVQITVEHPEQIDRTGDFGSDSDILVGLAFQMCDECAWSLD